MYSSAFVPVLHMYLAVRVCLSLLLKQYFHMPSKYLLKRFSSYQCLIYSAVFSISLFCLISIFDSCLYVQVHKTMVIVGIVFVSLGLFFILYAHEGKFDVVSDRAN